MTDPQTPTPDRANPRARDHRGTLAAAGAVVVLQAFAFGASGSVSALAGLTESALVLTGTLAVVFATRWRAGLPQVKDTVAEGMASLIQAGMALSAALIIGLIAIFAIFEPKPIGGGLWAVGAIAISLGLAAAIVALNHRSSAEMPRQTASYADLVPGFVVLLGVTAGAVLNAPGLDAAAALVVAVWLFWGALGSISSAVGLLALD